MPDISDDFSFDPRDVERVVKREHRQSLRRCRRQEHPEAILLAGQPGAGKTELTAAAMAERFSDSCMSINGDERKFRIDSPQLIICFFVISLFSTSSNITDKPPS